jgi:hypothetical protein
MCVICVYNHILPMILPETILMFSDKTCEIIRENTLQSLSSCEASSASLAVPSNFLQIKPIKTSLIHSSLPHGSNSMLCQDCSVAYVNTLACSFCQDCTVACVKTLACSCRSLVLFFRIWWLPLCDSIVRTVDTVSERAEEQ